MRVILFVALLLAIFGCQQKTSNNTAGNISTDHAMLKDELIDIAKRIYDEGLIRGTGGDISLRIDSSDQFIIKATGISFGDLNYETLSTLNTDYQLVSGNPKPSSESDIHAALYKVEPGINAIMHLHSPYVTAWATTGQVVPSVTQQSVNVLKDACLIPYFPVGSDELRDIIVSCYKNPEVKVVMMENHGFFIIGKNLKEIFYNAELVENTAKIAWLCKSLGKPVGFDYKERSNFHQNLTIKK